MFKLIIWTWGGEGHPVLTDEYLRRYLNDRESVQAVGTPVTDIPYPETEEIKYLRRYLGDKIN